MATLLLLLLLQRVILVLLLVMLVVLLLPLLLLLLLLLQPPRISQSVSYEVDRRGAEDTLVHQRSISIVSCTLKKKNPPPNRAAHF